MLSSDDEELPRDKDVYVTTHTPRNAREEAATGLRYSVPAALLLPCWRQALCREASGSVGPHRPWSEDPLPSSPYFSGEVGAGSRVLETLTFSPGLKKGSL